MTMARTRKSRKRKGKIKFKQTVVFVPKDSVKRDTIKQAPFIMNDNGLNMRIKIKRKSR